MHLRDEPDPLAAGPHRTPKVEPAPGPAAPVARAADPSGSEARSMLELQRLAGNASVSRLVAREAATAEAESDDPTAARSPVLDVLDRGGGEPLEDGLRVEMESRLGSDFGNVRVHRDAEASASAKSVDAHAYTVGNDVVFRSDRWDPSSTEGKRTLAHELTHVVQQSNGPVSGTPAPGGIQVSSPDDDFERAAERTADVALSAPSPSTAGASAAPTSAGAAIAQLEGNRDQPNRPPAGEEEEEILEGDEVAPPAQRAAAPGEPGQALEDEELEDEELGAGAVQRAAEDEELEEEPVSG